jgi:hypothetical protein
MVMADINGNIVLNLANLASTVTDTGVKIGDYTTTVHKIGIADYRSAISNLLSVFNLNSIIANYGK